ncbi:MAG: YfhO family protein, partial [Bacteroidota bacterium]
MKTPEIKTILPHIVAILIFIAITFIYYSPLLEGKKLKQDDIARCKGMSKEVVDFRERTGEDPLWTNSMFSGMPAYHISTIFPNNLFTYIKKVMIFFGVGSFLFWSLIGFYILLLSFRVDPWLGIAGAIAFSFSSYFFIVVEAGHNSKAAVISYMAPILAGVILSFRGKLILGGAITAFFLAIGLKSNHPQIMYYLFLILLIYGVFELVSAVRNKQLLIFGKEIGVLIVAALLAVGSNITNLWITYDYSIYTTRGKSELSFDKENKTSGLDRDYITAWSYGIPETMTLMIPNFMGGGSQGELSTDSETYKVLKQRGVPNTRQIIKQLPLYWGTQPFISGPVYAGAIVCFLCVLGLFIIKGRVKWWLLTATILSITLAWGENFPFLTDLFIDYLPGYNKFRSVNMILVIAEFTMPLLAILALNNIFKTETLSKVSLQKSLKYSFFIVGGIALLFALLPSLAGDFTGLNDAQLEQNGWPIDALSNDRKSLLRADAFRSFAFILLTGIVLWLFIEQKLKKQYCYAVIIALFLFDMWPINKRYLNNDNFIARRNVIIPYQPNQANLQILSSEMKGNPDIQKVIEEKIADLQEKKRETRQAPKITRDEMTNIQFTALNEKTDFRVINLTISTFNDASTSYFHKSIGGYHGAKLKRYQELIEFHISRNNMAVLNMLNTKYFIVKGEDNQPIPQKNPGALGNAWFVNEYKIVANADSEITALSGFEPSKTAIVDKRFDKKLAGFIPKTDPLSYIKLTEYQPNYLVYESKTSFEQLAVFSEIYFDKGWNAYVDGEPTSHFRVNYVLRAMRIPAGEHNIEFKFEPKEYYIGEKISFACSSLLLVVIVGISFLEIRRKFKS